MISISLCEGVGCDVRDQCLRYAEFVRLWPDASRDRSAPAPPHIHGTTFVVPDNPGENCEELIPLGPNLLDSSC